MENINMSESASEKVVVETSDDTTEEETAATAADTETVVDEGAQALGDAGKKALDVMKAERKAARDAAAAEKARADALQAKLDGKEAEHAAAQESQRVKDEALGAANQKILKAELRAAAKGKLTDPTDVFRFPEIVDLSAFEVGADGEVDADALEAAVNNLIARRPDLAAQGGKRFRGTGDGGPRNAANAQPPQLTKADLERMSREGKYDEITEAKKAGRFNDLLGIKP